MIQNEKVEKFKSLSADSELHSAYEHLKNGDYKLCKRLIEKKMLKLKSATDKVNFNIIKILLLNKTKKFKDAKKLIDSVKKEVIENPILNSNSDLCKYFKNILRELNEEQAANEIFKISIKNYNLAKIPRNEQKAIMKELTLNYEFQDLYTKITSFLKNDNDPDINFLSIMKYEIIYILSFKHGKLSMTIAKITFKEMMNNFSKFSSEKGFLDIVVKYIISLNDTKTFLDLFENKNIGFTNAPINDILIDIYFKNDDSLKLINFIMDYIKNNLEQYNFIFYQRLVNYVFYYYENKGLLNKINLVIDNLLSIEDLEKSYFSKVESLEDPNLMIVKLLQFFEMIKNYKGDKKTNFNAFKSSSFALLNIYHNLILIDSKNFYIFQKNINSIIFEIVDNSVLKQSILTEVSKYFIYLNKNERQNLLESFKPINTVDGMDIIKNLEYYERIIFYYKLTKMLDTREKDLNEIELIITELIHFYFEATSGQNKLEKGERLTGDDVVILINEYLFEFYNKNKEILNDQRFSILLSNILILNASAHERSPYNYDIALFYLKTAGTYNMPAKVLEILKFMNLKGPQFETVSYIAFPYFLNSFYRPGISFLIDQLDKWDSSNKKSIRKTFWKMFTGRNFWNTEELLLFLQENENSYYKHVLSYIDLLLSFNDNLTVHCEDEEIRKENLINLCDLILINFNKFDKILQSNLVTKNQDLLISIFKFKQVNFLFDDENVKYLKINLNYNENNYKYKIDSIWKNNIIYELYPSYKNNFLIQNDSQVLGIFNDMNFLHLRLLNRIISANIFEKIIPSNELAVLYKKYLEVFNNFISAQSNEELKNFECVYKNLLEAYFNCDNNMQNLVKNENIESIENNFTILKSTFCENFKKLMHNEKFKITNPFQIQNFNNQFHFFKNFYLPDITFIASKLLEIVNTCDKKVYQDSTTFRLKFTNNFKAPMMNFFLEITNFLGDYIKELEKTKSTTMELIDANFLNYYHKDLVISNSTKFSEEMKEHIKIVIENSKIYKNFIKDTI